MLTRLIWSCGFLVLFGGLAAQAQAFPTTVPEIDAGSAASALTLLTGSVMILASRFRRA